MPYPPDKGDKIRSFHLLVRLARSHSVDLVTHVDDPRDLRHAQILEDLCTSLSIFPLNRAVSACRAGLALFTGGPLSVAWMTREAARRRVAGILSERRPDLIVGYSGQVGAYLPPSGGPPVILDLVDVDSAKWSAYGAARGLVRGALDRLEGRRLRVFERRMAERCERVVLTTERERRLFNETVSSRPAAVISNGVVLPDAVPGADAREPGLMIFVGSMDYSANVEAAVMGATEILPQVRRTVPQARFRIVGRHPTRRVRRLAELPGVEVTGEVPDVEEHLRAAALALVPLRVVRGIQNKVLEAMANGLPVVASEEVARCLGDGARPALATGGDAAGLADHAAALLRDRSARERAGRAGREYVAANHDWDGIGAQWDRLIEEVMKPEVTCGGGA